MDYSQIPKDYTGVVSLYMSINGLHIEAGKITNTPLGSILNFIIKNGIIKAKYAEKFDEKGLLVYSYYYN